MTHIRSSRSSFISAPENKSMGNQNEWKNCIAALISVTYEPSEQILNKLEWQLSWGYDLVLL